MNKYLITGAAGFVGYHFIAYLNSIATEKIFILGVDINIPNDFSTWKFDNLEISFKNINLLDFNEIWSAIKDFRPTHILHLASLSSVGKSWQDPAGYFTNNTGIFLNLLEAVRKENLKCRILNIGSSEEYGFVDENLLPISEEININPSNPYAVTKLAQETLANVYTKGLGLNIISTRSFNHIGPRQRDNFVVASFAKQVANASLAGKKRLDLVTGNLNVIRDFLDVRDVVVAYYLLLEKGKGGEIYNVCSSEGISLTQIIDELSEISGIDIHTQTDQNLVRPNDLPKIFGCNKKLKNDTNWQRNINIHKTLEDIFVYWKEQLSK